MRIEAASVAMGGTHRFSAKHEKKAELKVWVGAPGAAGQAAPPSREGDRLTLSDAASRMEEHLSAGRSPGEEERRRLANAQLLLKILLIEALTGKRSEVLDHLAEEASWDGQASATGEASAAPAPDGGPSDLLGWGMEFLSVESYSEEEHTTFTARGTVRTADGRELGFEVRLDLRRRFQVENTIHLRAGDAAVDPLALNFDGAGVRLTDAKVAFDLNMDGRPEYISFVQPGSGFLALDRNGDGRVNDGSELFGPRGGDGFTELAAFDEDGNGWIDENDTVFRRLAVWTAEGELVGLGTVGVGAIFLGAADTPFAVKDGAGRPQGQVARSGVYLAEGGAPGVLQQVNLAV